MTVDTMHRAVAAAIDLEKQEGAARTALLVQEALQEAERDADNVRLTAVQVTRISTCHTCTPLETVATAPPLRSCVVHRWCPDPISSLLATLQAAAEAVASHWAEQAEAANALAAKEKQTAVKTAVRVARFEEVRGLEAQPCSISQGAPPSACPIHLV